MLLSGFGRTWLSLPRSPVSMTEGYLGARTSPGTRVAPRLLVFAVSLLIHLSPPGNSDR